FQKLGLEPYPDLVTVGKMLQGSAVLYTEAMNPDPELLAGTFAGSSVSLAVGRRIVERLLSENFFTPEGRIAALEKSVSFRLETLSHRLGPRGVGERRVCGTLAAFEPLDGDRRAVQAVLQACYRRGVILFLCGSGPFGVRMLLPGGAITEKDLDYAFDVIFEAVNEVRATIGP
ncbi:MAG: aminotransferase class III-fold pyridoxal phosphate-dependent enzyme, partial [Vicinamibacteria bacterium]